jgi:hypothetical protein
LGSIGVNGDHLASCLALEDNFAVNAKEGTFKGMDLHPHVYKTNVHFICLIQMSMGPTI